MWPTLLMLTMPENWTPHATYAATRIFASNLDPKQSQKFYKEILLEKVREEIGAGGSNKLSVHTYMALKKAIYKPAAFFKGILFPLCEVRQQPLTCVPRRLTWVFGRRVGHVHCARRPSSAACSRKLACPSSTLVRPYSSWQIWNTLVSGPPPPVVYPTFVRS